MGLHVVKTMWRIFGILFLGKLQPDHPFRQDNMRGFSHAGYSGETYDFSLQKNVMNLQLIEKA
jgi:hypothetical protein